MPSPQVTDISAGLAKVEDMGESHIAVVWDFKSAHRIVQAHPDDRGLQACTLAESRGCTPSADAEISLNTVATFDFATPGNRVGRPAALIMRGAHYTLRHSLKRSLSHT